MGGRKKGIRGCGSTTDLSENILPEIGAKTCLVVKENEQPLGCLVISDKVRPEVRGLVPKLYRLGLQKVVMLTGDSRAVAAQVARVSGIRDFEAGLLPEQKLQHIKSLQNHCYKVAMVGDGINDAPSLAAADIGIAMRAMGTDVAIESADIALMSDDITKIPYALEAGKATLKTINYNHELCSYR